MNKFCSAKPPLAAVPPEPEVECPVQQLKLTGDI